MPDGVGGIPPLYDRVARHTAERLFKIPGEHQTTEPAQDTNQQNVKHAQDFQHEAILRRGQIVTVLPYANWYVVQFSASANIPCCLLNGHALTPIGVKTAGVLQPGVEVWVVVPAFGQHGFILGVMPPMMSDSNLIFSDWVVQASGTGIRKEKSYKELPTLVLEGEKGGLYNFNAGSPIDGTSLGEWTKIAETGLALHLDSFMTYLRVSEMCGVWGFYHDELLRLAGRNFDLRTCGHEIIARDDEGEFQYLHGDTGYPWEATGILKYGDTNSRETDDEAVIKEAIHAKYEPAVDDQLPFYRYQEYGGYLGQGRQRLIVVPPRNSGKWRYSDSDKLQGLFSEHIGYNGQYGLQSAKGFSLVKRPVIVVPKRKKQAEDASEDGDNFENYKAAGQYGGGDDHKIGDIENSADYPQVMSVAGFLDMHAHAYNWQRLHPFHYHKKDFDTPQETELEKINKQQETIDFDRLKSQMWLDRPTAKQVYVDHRYKEVDYFQNMAGITVTDDGGVIIFDGYGSSISMTGGNISISPAGSLLLQPGKSLVGLAGDDVCLRAVNSVDVTAGNKDVRIKAEKNLQFLSGNAGTGGMLFDCRGTGMSQQYEGKFGEDVQSNGIVFKAAESTVVALGQDVYLRSLSGPCVLDASKGDNEVILIGQKILNYTNTSIVFSYGLETVESADVFQHMGVAFNGQLDVNGNALIAGNLGIGGGVESGVGFIAPNYPFVGELKDTAQLDAAIQAGATATQQAAERSQRYYDYSLTTRYYADQQPGSESFRQQAEFSYRNEQQYGTENQFMLPATYWQQLAAADGAGSPWEEPVVSTQGQEMLPWPGKKKWKDEDTYHNPQLMMFELSAGVDSARPGLYEEAKYGEWTVMTPAAGYLTIANE